MNPLNPSLPTPLTMNRGSYSSAEKIYQKLQTLKAMVTHSQI